MKSYDTIIYHGGCADGFCGTWLCHKFWPEAEYIPSAHGSSWTLNEEAVIDKNVLIIDFSFKRTLLEHYHKLAKSLFVLDHHKSAQKELEGLEYCRFDMTKSGGRLTLEYLQELFPESVWLKLPNWLVDYTEDRDLWTWKLQESREINAALRTYPMEWDKWDYLSRLPADYLVNAGTAILKFKQKQIDNHIKYARKTKIHGHEAAIVECSTVDLGSDIAEQLLEATKLPIAIIVIHTTFGFIYQLRSNTVDVSAIARIHGGGGHASAAGFEIIDYQKISEVLTIEKSTDV